MKFSVALQQFSHALQKKRLPTYKAEIHVCLLLWMRANDAFVRALCMLVYVHTTYVGTGHT